MINNIVGIVLAGGNSSRMGSNKALLPYQGRKLVAYMLNLLKDIGVEKTYVSGDIDGYDCIVDVIKNAGPTGGIFSVLNYLNSTSMLLFLPVDMPLLTPKLLSTLIEQNDKTKDAIVYVDHPLPLLLRHPSSAWQFLKNRFNASSPQSYSIKALLAGLNTCYLAFPDKLRSRFLNVNTPEEWQVLVQST